jgi:hypothetical protein
MSKRVYWIVILFCALLPFGSKAQNPNWANASPSQYCGAVACMYEDTTTDLLYIGSGNYVHVFNGLTYPIMGTSFGPFGVRAIIKYNGSLYVGSVFDPTKTFTRWNGTAWDTTGIAANAQVWALYEYNGDLYVGGSFTQIAGINANGLAKFDGANWSAVGNFPFGYMIGVNAITSYNGELYVGGSFGDSLSNTMNIARWNGSQWNTVGGGFHGGAAEVECLEVCNNKLYIGGSFTFGSGNVGDYIAQWDGTTLSGVGGGVYGVGNGQIHDLQTYHNELYAGGVFSSAGGVPAQYIAKWDGTNWCGSGDSMNNIVTTLGVYRDTLYMGGGFQFINADTIICLAKWIGGNFGDTCGFISTGVNEQSQENFSVQMFPNPITTDAIFQITGSGKNKTLIIYDQLGKEIWRKETSENQIEFSAEGFSSGLYFYRIELSGENKASGKFIIE